MGQNDPTTPGNHHSDSNPSHDKPRRSPDRQRRQRSTEWWKGKAHGTRKR